MDEVFRKASIKALIEWGRDGGVEDLVQDLWTWFYERPGTQEKLEGISQYAARKMVYKVALQILAQQALGADTFRGRTLYSSDSVREALHGLSNNKYLREILPIALEAVQHRDDVLEDQGKDRGYAEALRLRYEDKVFPDQGADQVRLSRAVKSLTDEINLLHLTAPVEGTGSRGEVFPGSRRASGGHADPTGDVAMLLIENPEIRDDYLEVIGINELLRGRGGK